MIEDLGVVLGDAYDRSFENEYLSVLYHGSADIVSKPEYGKGREKNDFGRGLYCTEDIELAKEWGAAASVSDTPPFGYSNKYLLNSEGLNVVDLTASNYSLLNWLAVLIKHRDFTLSFYEAKENQKYIIEHFYPHEVDQADVIIGYRADDSYFAWAKEFLADIISLEQLERAMHFGGLGNQVVLVSPKSFEQIEFLEYEGVQEEWYRYRKNSKEEKANLQYAEMKNKAKDKNDIKASDIREGGFTNDYFCVSKDVLGDRIK